MTKLPVVICPLCNRAWAKPPKRLLNGKTCCAKCAGIKGYLAGDHKETGIETKLYTLLGKLGVDFKKQQPVAGLCVADAFVAPNYVFFTDGTFWHGRPKQVVKDKRVTERLEKKGYVVLRYTEVEMNLKISAVKKKIKQLFGK